MGSKENDEWKRPAKYRAPSWSWAFIECPVTLCLQANTKIPGEEISGLPDNPQIFQLLEAKLISPVPISLVRFLGGTVGVLIIEVLVLT